MANNMGISSTLGIAALAGIAGIGMLLLAKPSKVKEMVRSLSDSKPAKAVEDTISGAADSVRVVLKDNGDLVLNAWQDMQHRVKAKWDDLSDEEIDRTEGKVDDLADAIQKQYGGTRAQILTELHRLHAKPGRHSAPAATKKALAPSAV